jgi:hypothetical protein
MLRRQVLRHTALGSMGHSTSKPTLGVPHRATADDGTLSTRDGPPGDGPCRMTKSWIHGGSDSYQAIASLVAMEVDGRVLVASTLRTGFDVGEASPIEIRDAHSGTIIAQLDETGPTTAVTCVTTSGRHLLVAATTTRALCVYAVGSGKPRCLFTVQLPSTLRHLHAYHTAEGMPRVRIFPSHALDVLRT